MIKRVFNDNYALKCDMLLTKLIHDEKKYDDFVNTEFSVNNYFKNVIKNNKNIVLCYEIEDNVVAYIYFKYQFIDNKKGYLIDGLYVIEEYRNRGIAKALIQYGLKMVNNSDIDFIDINVMAKNEIAIKLYKSFGFDLFSLKLRKK